MMGRRTRSTGRAALAALALIAAAALAPACAEAQQATINYSLVVPTTCTLSQSAGGELKFGEVGDTQAGSGSFSLGYNCTRGTTYTVTATGLNDDGATLRLQNTTGDFLPYSVFWGDTSTPIPRTAGSVSVAGGGGLIHKTILLQLPAATAARKEGHYTDTLTLTFSW